MIFTKKRKENHNVEKRSLLKEMSRMLNRYGKVSSRKSAKTHTHTHVCA